MKKLIIAAVAILMGGAAPGVAADMALKAAPAAGAPYDAWSGFYLGGSVGARSADVDWTITNYGATPASGVDNPASLDSTSARIGAYLGYNWRPSSSWLVGLEGDAGWGNNSRTRTPFPGVSVFGAGLGTGTDFITTKLGWDGSVRGRLGFLVAPAWLVYATGGVAWQEITTSATCGAPGPSFCNNGLRFAESSTTTKAGWTVGGGVETALSGHWLLRAEYRYADFGHVSNTLPPAPSVGFNASVAVKTNTATAGVAYKW